MVTIEPKNPRNQTQPLRAGLPIDAESFDELRRRLILDACKWDPQVGDVDTISRFPLIIAESEWKRLSQLASQLAAELMAAEKELLHRPDLHGRLGLPRRLRQALRRVGEMGSTPCATRVLRFDFHWTDQGWKISEVNSDVPGGFAEASELPALMTEHFPGTTTAGHPGSVWANSLATSASANPIALLSAAGFMEDRQVLEYLGRLLRRIGVESIWADPKQLAWHEGIAHLNDQPLGAIVRFYQAEWINPRKCPELFAGGKTPVSDPCFAALTESKRFPLVWDELKSALPTWRTLLPETRDPRVVRWQQDESWLVKSSMCNTGDTVAIRSLMIQKNWDRVRRQVWLQPENWIAQRRFVAVPLAGPAGPIYPCIGVYTIGGRVVGIYGRYSQKPLIDFAAVDVAVLIEEGV